MINLNNRELSIDELVIVNGGSKGGGEYDDRPRPGMCGGGGLGWLNNLGKEIAGVAKTIAGIVGL
jgi:hypothetical protein